MTTALLRVAALAAIFAGGLACDETSKECFDGAAGSVKANVAACGELCDKGDAKACDEQGALAKTHCLDGSDKEICRWMCDYAKDGKELYCARSKQLGG